MISCTSQHLTSWLVCSWLGVCRRPRHETVFLLVHCTGATARAHFFLFCCFSPQWNTFFFVFFWHGVVGWGVGWGGVNNVLWTWTHLGCYVMRSFLGIQNIWHVTSWESFLGIEHIWDVTSWDLFLELNTSGMLRHEIFSWNWTHLGCYVMRSFLGIQHIWDVTSWDLFLELNTSGMLRHEIFSWNWTHLGCYVMRSFLGIEHIWDVTSWNLFLELNASGMLRYEIFSWNSRHLGWYVLRSFLGIEHIWDGTSWDLFLELNTSGMLRHEIFSWKYTWKCLNWSSFFRRQHMTHQDINMDMWSCTCISNGQRGGFAHIIIIHYICIKTEMKVHETIRPSMSARPCSWIFADLQPNCQLLKMFRLHPLSMFMAAHSSFRDNQESITAADDVDHPVKSLRTNFSRPRPLSTLRPKRQVVYYSLLCTF